MIYLIQPHSLEEVSAGYAEVLDSAAVIGSSFAFENCPMPPTDFAGTVVQQRGERFPTGCK
ncbi:MAG: hypothetical protein H6558_00245 [Lewinellaceae bacterium]|nr:hypothetical protein [Lewinellaceae bacterium]